jgi:hypothetical protein
VITTVSFTRCWRKIQADGLVWLLCACLLAWLPQSARAEPPTVEIDQFHIDRSADGVFITASLKFELPLAVESALQSGAPLPFVAEAQVVRERWYWTDKAVISAQRHFRLSFQPVTRRWRLRLSNGPITTSGSGLSDSREFDTLSEAMLALQHLSHWRIGEAGEIDPEQKHRVEFKFYLDLSQLPLPFHISVLGQNDWSISASTTQRLQPEASK